MSNTGINRSFRTPSGYRGDPGGHAPTFDKTYLGIIKNNDDAFKMGRLKVWIPEFSANSDDEGQWFTVSYCSPFAGSTPVASNVKNGTSMSDTQQSYGWWSVPPNLDNEVIVLFIGGDPNRGVWIGCLYQQNMNHMVPGIPSGSSHSEGVEGIDPPVAEYNRWSDGVSNSDDHVRARFDPLHEGLVNQGLYEDPQRGPSTAGARRASVSETYGFKSPGGSHLVFDDHGENSYIRIRTAGGAQVLINDTAGYVYVNSGNGNSWLEVSDEGVDVYSARAISMRSQGDLNFHADGNINMYAKGGFNAYGGGGGSLQFGRDLNMLVGGKANISGAGEINLLSRSAIKMSSTGQMSLKSSGALAIDASGQLGLSASGSLNIKASSVTHNGPSGPRASGAAEASAPAPEFRDDRELNTASGYEEINTKSIVSRMPTHEPWSGHPMGPSGPARSRVDLGVSERLTYDGNANDAANPDDIQEGAQEPVPTDDTEFVSPVTGPITSVWGPRNVRGGSRNHKGIDVGVPTGTPIVAARAGRVVRAGRASGYGVAVYIQHDNGYTTEYGHLSAITVRVGQEVVAGQQIARSGNTGRSTGPHLHFTLKKNGQPINPALKLRNVARGRRLTAGRN